MEAKVLKLKEHLKNFKISKINAVLFVLYLLIYVTIHEYFFHYKGNSIANWRYYALIIIIIVGFVSLLFKHHKNKSFNNTKIYGKELFFSIITALVFLIISIIRANDAQMPLHYRTFVQICLWFLPAMYVIVFVNMFSMKTIFNLMKIVTIIAIVAYFQFPTHTIADFFNINNWQNIDFSKFISFTESTYYSETFLFLFLFFYYFKHQVKDSKLSKSLNTFAIVNFVFTILSFKRLGMLFAIFVIVYYHTVGKKLNFNKKISFKPALILSLIFTLLTFLYTKFMQGELFPEFDVYHFTSARSWILSLWAEHNYLSYGSGSSMLIIGRYLELDLIQIYLELNLFALFLFCFTFLRVAKKNIYANMCMIYVLLNMLTSSSLPQQIGWVIMVIVITTIASEKIIDEKLNTEIVKKESKKIKTIDDLNDWLAYEKKLYNLNNFDIITRNPKYYNFQYVQLLRKCEYYHNSKKIYLLPLFVITKIRKNMLGKIIGIEIGENCVGKGLLIQHCGIVINGNSKIGTNLTLNGCNYIGNSKDNNDCPVIGDNVDFGVGAVAQGDINIGNNVKIGENTTIIKSCDDNVTLISTPTQIERKNRKEG